MKQSKILIGTVLVFLNFITHTAHAQAVKDNSFDPHKSIVVDFSNKEIKLPKKLKDGDLFNVEIKNINQNLYRITISKTDTTINSDVTFPTFSSIDLSGLSDWITKLSPSSTVASKVVKPEDEVIKTLNTYSDKLNGFESSLKLYNLQIDSINYIVQKRVLSYKTLDTTIKDQLQGDHSISDIIVRIQSSRDSLQKLIAEILEQNTAYKKYIQNKKSIIDTKTTIKDFTITLTNTFSELDSLSSKVYATVNAQNSIGMIKPLITLENNKSDTYTSLPMMLDGDYSSIFININPIDDSSGLPSYSTGKIKLPQPSTWYVGMGISFYASDLRNKSYSIVENKIDSVNSTYKIVDEKNINAEIGIAALLHFGKKFTSESIFGWNVVIGPAVSISNVIKPRLTTGLGFTLGRKQMLSLNILSVAGYVDTKSNSYNVDEEYTAKPDQVTVSKLAAGWAFSLGYIYKF